MNVEDMNDQTPLLDVRGIAKSYGDTRVLDDVTFTAGSGEFVCIVGPSGSGKTTLLRALAALGPADSGEVRLNGEAIVKPPAELSVVFQDRKSTRLNSSHVAISYAVFCLKKKRAADSVC